MSVVDRNTPITSLGNRISKSINSPRTGAIPCPAENAVKKKKRYISAGKSVIIYNAYLDAAMTGKEKKPMLGFHWQPRRDEMTEALCKNTFH